MIRNEAPIYKKEEEKKIFKLKSTAEAQRLRLERLMSDPVGEMLNECDVISTETVKETVAAVQSSSAAGEKPHAKLNKIVVIPERPKDNAPKAPPEFIRNIWGSSAGVGSGDFHIYRGIRRREYARQKFNAFMKEKEEKDRRFDEKIQKNAETAEAKTAKKRAKRLKQKERLKRKRQQKKDGSDSESGSGSSSDEETSSSEGEQGESKKQDEGNGGQKAPGEQSSSSSSQSEEENSSRFPKVGSSNDADDSNSCPRKPECDSE